MTAVAPRPPSPDSTSETHHDPSRSRTVFAACVIVTSLQWFGFFLTALLYWDLNPIQRNLRRS
jgi:hypothetical protein